MMENERHCGCKIEPLVEEYPCDMEAARRELMSKIKALNFAIIELALYLDTHPEDEKAICMHKEYARELKCLKDKYQKMYGPLSIYYPCNKWRWIEEPWGGFSLGVKLSIYFRHIYTNNKEIK